MLLGDVLPGTGVDLIRQGSFDDLGFVSDSRGQMFTFVAEPRFLDPLLKNSAVSAVITTQALAGHIGPRLGLAVCGQPRLAFARIHNALCNTNFYWTDFTSAIHPEARVHSSAWIAERNVRIGARSVVGPRAVVLERCDVGGDCVVGAGCVLGGAGFQTVQAETELVEMSHAGALVLRERVHILPGAVIATGLFRHSTEIESDARIGSQAFVSHAVKVGRAAFIGHGAVINGNVRIAEQVWIGPGAVVANNLSIGERAVVSLGAVVIRDVAPETRVSGNFAEPHRSLMRRMAAAPGGIKA